MKPKFSIIIPIYNEGINIINLFNEIISISFEKYDYEIVIVDDSSDDNSQFLLSKLYKQNKIKYIRHSANLGQSRAINTGINNSSYDTIVTIDGDGQNDPLDINKILDVYYGTIKYDLVGGIRKKRKDSFLKIISSRVANFIRSKILKDKCPDTGCSLKVFEKKTFLKFPYFDGIHRFLPALFIGYGYRTHYINVHHRHRTKGYSKYGILVRLYRGIIDIIKVKKIIEKQKDK